MSPSAVEITSLSYAYPAGRKKERKLVLKDLSLQVDQGCIYGVLGPNGGGKTTLFRIVSTAIPFFEKDKIKIFGEDLAVAPQNVREKFGVVFQQPSLDGKLTLLENLKTQTSLYGVKKEFVDDRISDILSRLSLEDRANDYVENLSGGLQRRGEIAKSLLHHPDLLLMDEPSTGLDPGARHELWELLKKLKSEGVTILLTTHLMEEGERCDRLAIVHHGQVILAGTPEDLKKRIGGDVVWIRSKNASNLSSQIESKFSIHPSVIGNDIRIEIQNGHQFIPSAVEAFPGEIEEISVGKPTLEDVFIRETGRRFAQDEA